MGLRSMLEAFLGRAGLQVTRSDAARRVGLLSHHRVDLVVDVGAAVGKYGLELRRQGYRGRLVSFEPLPPAFGHLSAKASRDPLWDVHNLALGADTGALDLNVAGNGDSSSFLPMLDRHRRAAPHADYVRTERVLVETIDRLLRDDMRAHRGFVKVDVQGFEREVLAGAVESLTDCVGLQLELSLVPLYDGAMLFDEAVELAHSLGMHLEALEPGFRDPSTGQLLQADGVFFRS